MGKTTKKEKDTVVKVFKGKVVTLSEENNKYVAIVELNERIIPRWDVSPKVLQRIAFPCKPDALIVGDKIEVVIKK
jgi:hypothetical protein